MKYIGPFLRMNTLSKDNVERQLLHYAKESFKHILLNSRCGVTTSINDLKIKNIPNFDNSTFKRNSPLLCVYKKANPKLIIDKEHMKWDDDTFKKEINIYSNAYMTLTLTELYPHYFFFKGRDEKLYTLSKIYSKLARKQLDFYTSNLRNLEGVFVDKKDSSDNITGEQGYEEKSKKFKFSDQALIMAAYYKISQLDSTKDKEAYETFSKDILNMFIGYRNELYSLSFEELNKLSLAMNIFYDYSKLEEVKLLLVDLNDLLLDSHDEKIEAYSKPKEDSNLEYNCMLYLNMMLAYKSTSISKFKDKAEKLYNELINLYDEEKGIFLKKSDKKEVDYSCQEITLYILSLLLHSKYYDCDDNTIIINVYKNQLVNSGIVLSWPDTPELDNAEKYENYSLHSEDLLQDDFFRNPTSATPETSELAPIFIKNVQYNIKKQTFTPGKTTFDSTKNMPIIFLIIYLFNSPNLTSNLEVEETEETNG